MCAVNLFEAAKNAGIARVVYASSVAMYGRSEESGTGALGDDAPLNLCTHKEQRRAASAHRGYWLAGSL